MILDELGIKIEEEPAPFKVVGERIKQARKFKCYTQFEVADWLGINFVKYNHIEHGRELPDKKLAKKIGNVLDSDYEFLLNSGN